ncbi:hypothetical protein BSKO_10882 [Bryopsis sp. KO-2023]|nr:hypothetical protein BSKO_10882 [Bryopsis sp. KO-2023]
MSNIEKPSSDQIVLEEVVDDAYEPTDEEIQEYAQWLGLDDLLWIAREGLKAPLPQDWKPCQDADGELYYFNFITGESIWDHPCDKYYKDLYEREKKKESISESEERTPPASPPTGPLKTLDQISPFSGQLGKLNRLQPLAPIGGSSPPLGPLRGALPPMPAPPVHPLLGPSRPTAHSPPKGAQAITPNSRGGTSTSSTTPSSEWRKTVSPRSVTEQEELRGGIDKERKTWKEKQEKEFEEWKKNFLKDREKERKQLEDERSDLRKKLEDTIVAAKADLAAQEESVERENSIKLRNLEKDLEEKFEEEKETLSKEFEIKLDTLRKGFESSSQEEERAAKELFEKNREERRTAEKQLEDDLADALRSAEQRLREKHETDVKSLEVEVEKSFAEEKAAIAERLEKEKNARLEEFKKEHQQQTENEIQQEKDDIKSAWERMKSQSACTSSTGDDDGTSDVEEVKSSLRDEHDRQKVLLEEELRQELDDYRLRLTKDLEEEKLKLEEDMQQSIDCVRGTLEVKEKEEHNRLQSEHGKRVKAMIEKFDSMEKDLETSHPEERRATPAHGRENCSTPSKPTLPEEAHTNTEAVQTEEISKTLTNPSSELKVPKKTGFLVDLGDHPEALSSISILASSHKAPAEAEPKICEIKDDIVGAVQKTVEEAFERAVVHRMHSVIHNARESLDASVEQGVKRAIELEMPRLLKDNLKAIQEQMLNAETTEKGERETRKRPEIPGESEGNTSDGSISEVETHTAPTYKQNKGSFKAACKRRRNHSKHRQAPERTDVGDAATAPSTLSLEAAKRFIRLQKRIIKKRRDSLEAARKSWMLQWRDLACESDSGVLHAKQAVLQDMWVALEGQARRLNTDIGSLQNLKTRLRSLGGFLVRNTDIIPLTTDESGRLSDLLGNLSGGRSIEVFNQVLAKAMEGPCFL